MTRKQERKMIENAVKFGTIKKNGVIYELKEEGQKQAEIILKVMDFNAAMKKKKYDTMKKMKLRVRKFMSPLSGKNKAQRARVVSGFQTMMLGNRSVKPFQLFSNPKHSY